MLMGIYHGQGVYGSEDGNISSCPTGFNTRDILYRHCTSGCIQVEIIHSTRTNADWHVPLLLLRLRKYPNRYTCAAATRKRFRKAGSLGNDVMREGPQHGHAAGTRDYRSPHRCPDAFTNGLMNRLENLTLFISRNYFYQQGALCPKTQPHRKSKHPRTHFNNADRTCGIRSSRHPS